MTPKHRKSHEERTEPSIFGIEKSKLLSWRRWLAGSLLATTALSIAANESDTIEGIHIDEGTYSTSKTVTTTESKPTGKTVPELVPASRSDIKGSIHKGPGANLSSEGENLSASLTTEQQREAQSFVRSLDLDHKTATVRIVGMESDEDATANTLDRDIGQASEANVDLAEARAHEVARYLEQYADQLGRGDRLSIESIEGREVILSRRSINALQAVADKHSVDINGLIQDFKYNHTIDLSTKDVTFLDRILTSQRGIELSSELREEIRQKLEECSTVQRIVDVPEYKTETETHEIITGHHDPGIEITPLFLPLVTPRRKRESEPEPENEDPKKPGEPKHKKISPTHRVSVVTEDPKHRLEPETEERKRGKLVGLIMRPIDEENKQLAAAADRRLERHLRRAAMTPEERAVEDSREWREINLKERHRQEKERRDKRRAGILAIPLAAGLIALLPIPDTEKIAAEGMPDQIDNCVTITYEPGSIKETTFKPLTDVLFGEGTLGPLSYKWTTRHSQEPTVQTTTTEPVTDYIINKDGLIVSEDTRPATVSRVDVAPQFKK